MSSKNVRTSSLGCGALRNSEALGMDTVDGLTAWIFKPRLSQPLPRGRPTCGPKERIRDSKVWGTISGGQVFPVSEIRPQQPRVRSIGLRLVACERESHVLLS